MELEQTLGQPAQQGAFMEWAVGRRDGASGVRKVLHPIVKSSPGGTIAALIDAAGTGEIAQGNALAAAGVVEEFKYQPLIELFARCEKNCLGTDGVAMNAVRINPSNNTINWHGVGNIHGVLFRRSPAANPRIHFLERNDDLLGKGVCKLTEFCLPVKPGDLIIFATDGIDEKFIEALPIDGKPRLVADELLNKFSKENVDCAMVVVRYLGSAL